MNLYHHLSNVAFVLLSSHAEKGIAHHSSLLILFRVPQLLSFQFNQSFDLPQQLPSGFAGRHPVSYRYPEPAVKVVHKADVATGFSETASFTVATLNPNLYKPGHAGARAAGNAPVKGPFGNLQIEWVVNYDYSFGRVPGAHVINPRRRGRIARRPG